MSTRLEALLVSRERLFHDRLQFKTLLETGGDTRSDAYAEGVLAGTEMMIKAVEREIDAERSTG